MIGKIIRYIGFIVGVVGLLCVLLQSITLASVVSVVTIGDSFAGWMVLLFPGGIILCILGVILFVIGSESIKAPGE